MTYTEIRSYMKNLETRGIRPGTGSVKALLHKLGDPQDKIRCIHVAGTNGKGSVCAMLARILKECGYRVGRYSSPAISDPKEIIRIDEKPISEDMYIRSAKKVIATGDETTVFEFETAMAFLTFEEQQCDVAIIETGMGGRDDATNVIKSPTAVILTPISLDHMSFLGNTVEAIAENKCGIIKDGCPVITSYSNRNIKAIEKECIKHNSSFCITDEPHDIKNCKEGLTFSAGHYNNISLSLNGAYQADNASLAIRASEALKECGFDWIDEQKIRRALLDVHWPGRYEKLSIKPVIIADGAHNRAAVKALTDSVRAEYPDKKIVVLMSVFADKEYEVMLKTLSCVSDTIICTTSGKVRSLSPKTLAECAKKYFSNVNEYDIFEKAFENGREIAYIQDAVLLICGSLSNISYLHG